MKESLKKLLVLTSFLIVFAGFAWMSYYIAHRDIRALSQTLGSQDGYVAKAFFSQHTDLQSLLVSLIDAEKKEIRFSIYTFTDTGVAQALIRAARRGVRVEGIVDRSYGESRSSKVCMLANALIPIWVFQTAADERKAGLMHNKFMLFSESIDQKALVWTGSYNFTLRAREKNEENVVILDSASLVAQYAEYFDSLKKRSLQISGPIQCSDQPEKHTEPSWLTKLRTLF